MRYHLSPATGRPNICRAEKECPIGGDHFDNKVDARASYEASQKENTIPAVTKKAKLEDVAPTVEKDEPDVTDLQDETLEHVDDADAWAEQILREVGEVEPSLTASDDDDYWADEDDDEQDRPKAYSFD